ncbi:MAG: pitrilysin family protein [Deltaproteobacteria bacterium]|nr:pitrilysin family protein [Deltaproteobacteria bacterium]
MTQERQSVGVSKKTGAVDDAWIEKLNRNATRRSRVRRLSPVAFGAESIERYELGNGLRVFLVAAMDAPVVSFHCWFAVGSRHERKGKTGLAHLFEHLMFNETKNLPAGTFDRKLEAVGASTNAATWTDWTFYHEDVPADALGLVIELEAERIKNLVLREPQLESEKEVVANERRYRVEDDVDGTVSEVLYKTAFVAHTYHHPTIGWMEDIEGFTTKDCRTFYEKYYAPNNASIVIVGHIHVPEVMRLIQKNYGDVSSAKLPVEVTPLEPEQLEEREEILHKPTPTARLAIGWKSPPMSHPDHVALSLLCEAMTAGRSSRFFRALVTEGEVATDVGASVGQFRDEGLFELQLTARDGVSARELLAAVDREVDRLLAEPITIVELERAAARLELGFLQGLETVGGRAEQIGFYQTVLNDPAGSLTRLEALRGVDVQQLDVVAKKYLRRQRRTVVLVEPEPEVSGEEVTS